MTCYTFTLQTMVFLEQLQEFAETAGAMLLMHGRSYNITKYNITKVQYYKEQYCFHKGCMFSYSMTLLIVILAYCVCLAK